MTVIHTEMMFDRSSQLVMQNQSMANKWILEQFHQPQNLSYAQFVAGHLRNNLYLPNAYTNLNQICCMEMHAHGNEHPLKQIPSCQEVQQLVSLLWQKDIQETSKKLLLS